VAPSNRKQIEQVGDYPRSQRAAAYAHQRYAVNRNGDEGNDVREGSNSPHQGQPATARIKVNRLSWRRSSPTRCSTRYSSCGCDHSRQESCCESRSRWSEVLTSSASGRRWLESQSTRRTAAHAQETLARTNSAPTLVAGCLNLTDKGGSLRVPAVCEAYRVVCLAGIHICERPVLVRARVPALGDILQCHGELLCDPGVDHAQLSE